MTTAYPLAWPPGWPRAHGRRAWKNSKLTFARARDGLLKELRLLGATHVVLSTNYELGTRTNLPLASRGTPADKGIAVYFSFKKKPMCMACDRYANAEGNVRSLTLAIAGMRALERHGGGFMMERAFSGFEALPPPTGTQEPPRPSCWMILGFTPSMARTAENVRARYRARVMECHPDQGGTDKAMADLTRARDTAMRLVAVNNSVRGSAT